VNPATFDVDGFRCDVAYAVPTSFWEEARAELVKVKPDIMMLAEASKPELLVKAFDIDYSWPLQSTLNDVLLKGAPATAFKQSWEQTRREFPTDSLHLRFSDNHDEARAVARFGIRVALAASVLMFSLDGVPLIYNGMEVGDATESGDPALFEKLPIFWHPKDRPSFRATYQDLIKLRSEHAAFHSRKVTWVHNSDEANVVTFVRSDDKEEFLVVINFSNRGSSGKMDVAHAGEFQPEKLSGTSSSHANPPALRLNGFEWRIYRRAISEVAEHEATPAGNSTPSAPTATATYNSAH